MTQELLSVEQMQAAEQYMFAHGTKSYALMQRAGEAVAALILKRYKGRRVVVLVGPGNNGGDGLIAAQKLFTDGMDVRVALLESAKGFKGDAAHALAQYKGKKGALTEANLNHNPVVIDALFGTGLARPIEGIAAGILREVAARRMDVVAVDMASGIQGNSAEVLGIALNAAVTVTFARKKLAHALLPGRELSGEIVVVDIGINSDAIASVKPHVFENHPEQWRSRFAFPKTQGHKYDRGHTLVVGGPMLKAGAAKLAALGALRAGSGLVSIVCAKKDEIVYATSALSLMTESQSNWAKLLKDQRCNTVVIGPGAGADKRTRDLTLAALKTQKNVVLDADALTSFAGNARLLFGAIKSSCVLTPHEGEFARLFKHIAGKSKLEKALKAAALAHAVVVLKGSDTVIAAPDGRACINSNAPPYLATAGAGDVLAGIIAGLLAQGMNAFDAACAAVWLHGEAARQHGPGLIAEDLPCYLPRALQSLK